MMETITEQYPSCYDLIPGTAQRVVNCGKWFVLWFAPRWEVFVALNQKPTDERVWYGYTLELEGDGTYDVCETSLGTTLLNTCIEKKQCDITADRSVVDRFFENLRKRHDVK